MDIDKKLFPTFIIFLFISLICRKKSREDKSLYNFAYLSNLLCISVLHVIYPTVEGRKLQINTYTE